MVNLDTTFGMLSKNQNPYLALLSLTACRKKLYLCYEILVLMEYSVLLDGMILKIIAGVGRVSNSLSCPLQGPGCLQALERRCTAANYQNR